MSSMNDFQYNNSFYDNNSQSQQQEPNQAVPAGAAGYSASSTKRP